MKQRCYGDCSQMPAGGTRVSSRVSWQAFMIFIGAIQISRNKLWTYCACLYNYSVIYSKSKLLETLLNLERASQRFLSHFRLLNLFFSRLFLKSQMWHFFSPPDRDEPSIQGSSRTQPECDCAVIYLHKFKPDTDSQGRKIKGKLYKITCRFLLWVNSLHLHSHTLASNVEKVWILTFQPEL